MGKESKQRIVKKLERNKERTKETGKGIRKEGATEEQWEGQRDPSLFVLASTCLLLSLQ